MVFCFKVAFHITQLSSLASKDWSYRSSLDMWLYTRSHKDPDSVKYSWKIVLTFTQYLSLFSHVRDFASGLNWTVLATLWTVYFHTHAETMQVQETTQTWPSHLPSTVFILSQWEGISLIKWSGRTNLTRYEAIAVDILIFISSLWSD